MSLSTTSRRRYREPQEKARLIRRLVIALIILVALVLIAFGSWRLYNELNDKPPVSVTYIHHESPDKNVPVPQKMFAQIDTLSSPLARGADGELRVKTNPNTTCSASFDMTTNPHAVLPTLGKETASKKGIATWKLTVPDNATKGNWQVIVRCADRISHDLAHATLAIK